MRFAIDTGGTFTDLVLEDDAGRLFLRKSPTTPDDPVQGILAVLDLAARDLELDSKELLRRGEIFIYGTTGPINAILTGNTARTAFLTTEGHPDVLLIREGGRDAFNLVEEYPDPYIPRSLTFEVSERIGSQGEIVKPFDDEKTLQIIQQLRDLDVEAVAVCLLWSIVKPDHELRLAELLERHLPDVPYTLSHQLNPSIREYRRASATAIDASLKPVTSAYLTDLGQRLRDAGFAGRLLLMTSGGGVMDVSVASSAPIHLIKSGPAAAPVAGRHFGSTDADSDTVLVIDTGGTSCDVSLVRRGKIPMTRETWLGPEWTGHMTGFPSIDVRSIGAGGGSIVWVDEGGLLHVGPDSAGAVPGPACYGKGGTRPTVTDACVVLGYIDPTYFLGGEMPLDVDAAREAVETNVGRRLGLGLEESATAVMEILTEQMVQLIEELSLNQGVDTRTAVLVGGGGAAGLNAVPLARRLGSARIVIPEPGAVLSAFGALSSDLSREFVTSFITTTDDFDFAGVNKVLDDLQKRCHEFIEETHSDPQRARIEVSAEMRYPSEVWELEVPIEMTRFETEGDLERMRDDFTRTRMEVFNTSDPNAPIVAVAWRAKVSCPLRDASPGRPVTTDARTDRRETRSVYFNETGFVETTVRYFETLAPGETIEGPAIVESPQTTVVLDPGAAVERTQSGSLLITPDRESERRLAHVKSPANA